MNVDPARTRATRCGAFTMRQWPWAAWMSLKAMARPAALDPGPLVTFVLCRTVAKVDDWVGGAQMHPVLARVVVEREQLVEVIGDLRGGLGELRPVSGVKRIRRGPRVVLVLGTPDFREGFFRGRVRGPRQRRENIR